MVRVAMRMESTSFNPTQHLLTALTILLTSTGSKPPLRFVTRIEVDDGDSEGAPPSLKAAPDVNGLLIGSTTMSSSRESDNEVGGEATLAGRWRNRETTLSPRLWPSW